MIRFLGAEWVVLNSIQKLYFENKKFELLYITPLVSLKSFKSRYKNYELICHDEFIIHISEIVFSDHMKIIISGIPQISPRFKRVLRGNGRYEK